MNKKLLVTLLHKNIEELNMITESFKEMEEFPKAIVLLARRKTEDIQLIIDQLSEIKPVAIEKTHEKSEGLVDDVTFTEALNVEDITVTIEPDIKVEQVIEAVVESEIIEQEINTPTITEPMEETIIVNEPVETITESTEEFTIIETDDIQEITIETKETKEIVEHYPEHEIKITTDETKKTTLADKIIAPKISRNEVMSKADNSISASIANKKITDIKQAISIGDRFRFQRELFKGNGEDMNKTLNYINQLASFEEVISFLKSKYGWEDDSEVAEDFLQIAKRKF